MADRFENGIDTRLEWVEPDARSLAVSETSAQPNGVGADGETIWTDCSLS